MWKQNLHMHFKKDLELQTSHSPVKSRLVSESFSRTVCHHGECRTSRWESECGFYLLLSGCQFFPIIHSLWSISRIGRHMTSSQRAASPPWNSSSLTRMHGAETLPSRRRSADEPGRPLLRFLVPLRRLQQPGWASRHPVHRQARAEHRLRWRLHQAVPLWPQPGGDARRLRLQHHVWWVRTGSTGNFGGIFLCMFHQTLKFRVELRYLAFCLLV